MEKEISKFTKISKERIRKTTAREIGRNIGQVEKIDSEKEDKFQKIDPNKVKKEILDMADSNQSIDSFEKNVLIKDMKIKGTNRKLKSRNRILKFLKNIMSGKTADDYKKMKDDEIKKAA